MFISPTVLPRVLGTGAAVVLGLTLLAAQPTVAHAGASAKHAGAPAKHAGAPAKHGSAASHRGHARSERRRRRAPRVRFTAVTGPTAPIIHATTTWDVPAGFGVTTPARTTQAHTVTHESWTEVGGGYRYVEHEDYRAGGVDVAPPFEIYGDAHLAIAGRIGPDGAWLHGADAPRGRTRCVSDAERWAADLLRDLEQRAAPTLTPGETWELLPAGSPIGPISRAVPADVQWQRPGSCAVFDLDGDGIETVSDLRAAGSL